MTRCSDIMTTDVACCRLGDTLAKAAMTMWDRDCGCVPILDGHDHVIGMLTDRDIAMAALFGGGALTQLSVDGAMSKQLFIGSPEDTTLAAICKPRVHDGVNLP